MPPPVSVPRVYDSAARPPAFVEELLVLVRYRDLLVELIRNNLRTRYKRSLLGIAWTLLNPLVTMAVTTIAFSRIFRMTDGAYPVYVLSGILIWTFFSQSTATAMHGLVWSGGHLLKRVSLPRSIFSVAAVLTGAINLCLGLIPLLAIMLVTGNWPTPALLFLPVALLIAITFVIGTALLFSAIAVFFVDMIEIFQAAVTALFYLTPVLYPMRIVPAEYAWVTKVNPMTYILETFRAPIYAGRLPDGETLAVAAACALASLALGWTLFTWKADEFVFRA
jgi:ABC-type polysaccharide/polyol phosphate export permease